VSGAEEKVKRDILPGAAARQEPRQAIYTGEMIFIRQVWNGRICPGYTDK
jgi:hypothetical protein